jgi:transcriptional regulator with XRE-family HTH domain
MAPQRSVRQLREDAAISQRELAHRVGVSQQTVSDWERGRALPEMHRIPLLAEVLGTDAETMAANVYPGVDGTNPILDEAVIRHRVASDVARKVVEQARELFGADFMALDEEVIPLAGRIGRLAPEDRKVVADLVDRLLDR